MESEFIAWLRGRLPPHRLLKVGPGDDAAIIDLAGRTDVVVTTDMLMDGVDFRLVDCDPRRVGRKALAVNLSDLAAMASQPIAAVVSLALPHDCGLSLGRELYEGLIPLAEEFDAAIAGGDTNTWDGPLVVSITAFGTVADDGPWRRNGARPGDAIVVTGDFGGSLLGKHFDFTPRVREALLLNRQYDVHAAIDVSDGLSLDVNRVAIESGCGAELALDRIPLAAATRSIEKALGDGEDFELVMAVAFDDAERMIREQPLEGVRLTMIGHFIKEPGLWSVDAANRRTPLAPRGYEHRMT